MSSSSSPAALVLFRKSDLRHSSKNLFIKFRKYILPKHVTFINHLVASRADIRIVLDNYNYNNKGNSRAICIFTRTCWTMQLCWNFLTFIFFSLLNKPRRYISPFLGCLLLSFIHTWSPWSIWPYSSLVIVCFSGSSSFLYKIAEFIFPDSLTNLFPLNLFRGWPK